MSPSCPLQLPVKRPPMWNQFVLQPLMVNVRVLTQPVPVRLHMPEPSSGCPAP